MVISGFGVFFDQVKHEERKANPFFLDRCS